MEIFQIVPKLPPAISGVGDYAYLLAVELRRAHGINTRFLVCDPSLVGSADVDGFSVHRIETGQQTELNIHIGAHGTPDTVLLHYVGYGYAQRGCPFWLVKGLEHWKKQSPNRKLVVMFHEIAARGNFPSSSFFNSCFQRWLAGRLAKKADVIHTNTFSYSRTLQQIAPKHVERIVVQPVFSNVGEVLDDLSFAERKPYGALFGSHAAVHGFFDFHGEKLCSAFRQLQIKVLYVIGAKDLRLGHYPLQIRQLGTVSAGEISAHLVKCRVGLVDCLNGRLAKSSVFAAYCAHRVTPVLLKDNDSEADGLYAGHHFFVSGERNSVPLAELENMASNAAQWYQKHSISQTAQSFAVTLKSLPAAFPCDLRPTESFVE